MSDSETQTWPCGQVFYFPGLIAFADLKGPKFDFLNGGDDW